MAWPSGYQPFGPNRAPLLTGLSATNGTTPIPVAVNATTGALVVSGGSGGGDVQYASGTTTPSPVTGNALIFDSAGTLQNVSNTNPLPVSATISTAGLATSSNQTNNAQTTQVVNSSGNPITSTNVNGSTQSLNVFVQNATAGSLLGRINLYDSTNSNAAGVASNGAVTVQGVSGGVAQPVSGTVAATQNGTWNIATVTTVTTVAAVTAITNALPTGTNTIGTVLAKEVASTSAVTSVAGSATTVSLLALNANRRVGTFFNDSSAILYLKLGATASTTSYTIQIVANGYYEIPQPCYTGAIDGIWASATGNVRITEITT